ncbi:MAG: hypothetical protein ACKVS9_06700 [Phycisphaerae bacterium]
MADVYDDSLLCPDCGYSLRGISSDRCPECGLDITFIRENRSVIPWVNRREIGVWRAYWQTVWQVIARRKEFLREVAKPVSYREAAAFRRMTLGFVALAMGIGWLGMWMLDAEGARSLHADYGVWFIVLCGVCFLMALRYQSEACAALIFGAGVSRLLATRIRILSIYSIGSLAISPLLITLAVALPYSWRSGNDRSLIAIFTSFTCVAILPMLWLVELAAIAARALRSRLLANAHTLLSLVTIMGIAALIAVGIPATAFASLVVFYTLGQGGFWK